MPDRCIPPSRSPPRLASPVGNPALSIRDHRSFTNRECQSPRPPRGDSPPLSLSLSPLFFFVLTSLTSWRIPPDSTRTFTPFLFLSIFFPLTPFVSSYLLFRRPLAPSSVTETTGDRVSGRIFLMAVIAHSGERKREPAHHRRPRSALWHRRELLFSADKRRNSRPRVAASDLGQRVGSISANWAGY